MRTMTAAPTPARRRSRRPAVRRVRHSVATPSATSTIAGDTCQHRGDVVAADAVDEDVADAVRGAADDREGSGEDREPAADEVRQAACDDDQQRRERQRDEAAGEMVAGRHARLGMDEGVVGDGDHHDRERGAEGRDAVPRQQHIPSSWDQGDVLRHGPPPPAAWTAPRGGSRRCGTARRAP